MWLLNRTGKLRPTSCLHINHWHNFARCTSLTHSLARQHDPWSLFPSSTSLAITAPLSNYTSFKWNIKWTKNYHLIAWNTCVNVSSSHLTRIHGIYYKTNEIYSPYNSFIFDAMKRLSTSTAIMIDLSDHHLTSCWVDLMPVPCRFSRLTWFCPLSGFSSYWLRSLVLPIYFHSGR